MVVLALLRRSGSDCWRLLRSVAAWKSRGGSLISLSVFVQTSRQQPHARAALLSTPRHFYLSCLSIYFLQLTTVNDGNRQAEEQLEAARVQQAAATEAAQQLERRLQKAQQGTSSLQAQLVACNANIESQQRAVQTLHGGIGEAQRANSRMQTELDEARQAAAKEQQRAEVSSGAGRGVHRQEQIKLLCFLSSHRRHAMHPVLARKVDLRSTPGSVHALPRHAPTLPLPSTPSSSSFFRFCRYTVPLCSLCVTS